MALKPIKSLSAALNTMLHTFFVKSYIPFLSWEPLFALLEYVVLLYSEPGDGDRDRSSRLGVRSRLRPGELLRESSPLDIFL